MKTHSVHIVAKMTAKPEAAAELERALSGLIGPSRAETGCLRYELFRSQASANEFLFVEEWADEVAFETHLATPHLQEALSLAKPLLSKVIDMRKYTPIGAV